MPLRIGFDLDGVFADMESALIRSATDVFGEAMIDRLQERANENAAADTTASADDTEGSADSAGQTVAENTPPILRIKMTPRQTSRLWRQMWGRRHLGYLIDHVVNRHSEDELRSMFAQSPGSEVSS